MNLKYNATHKGEIPTVQLFSCCDMDLANRNSLNKTRVNTMYASYLINMDLVLHLEQVAIPKRVIR